MTAHRGAFAALALVLGTTCLPLTATAEAVLDGSTGSTGSFSGDFEIPATVGRQEGANLFHSFERFAVRTGESATILLPVSRGVELSEKGVAV